MSQNVQFLNLKRINAAYDAEFHQALDELLEGGWFIGGRLLEQFEQTYAAYCEAKHCVGVGNGLDALELSLRAVGVQPGDEVIVPANTYIATWLAVTNIGAVVAPVEPDERTCNIDPAKIEAAVTPKTKAVLPVHLYGLPAPLDDILDIAKRHGLKVVEDGAQAHGARVSGRRLGARSDAVAWSFYPGKNLGALGDGGAVTTDDAAVAERVAVLRNYGSRVKYVNEALGRNSRLDPLQAAFLSRKLPGLDQANARRGEIATRYLKAFAGTELTLPVGDGGSVWHLFTVRHPRRDRLQAELQCMGVGTMIHYPIPPHLQAAYAHLGWGRGSFPITERTADQLLSLPMDPTMLDDEVETVVQAVLSGLDTA